MPIQRVTGSHTLNPASHAMPARSTCPLRHEAAAAQVSIDIGAADHRSTTQACPPPLSPCGGSDAPSPTRQDTTALLQGVVEALEALQDVAMAGMSRTGCDVVIALERLVRDGAPSDLRAAPPSTPAEAITLDATAFLQDRQRGQSAALPTAHERATTISEFVMHIVCNDFSSSMGRWTANIVNTCVRTGLVVAVAVILRQQIGFFLERYLYLEEVPELPREVVAASAALTGPVLNLVGMLRDWHRGGGTTAAHVSRLLLILGPMAGLTASASLAAPSRVGPDVRAGSTPSVLGTIGATTMQMLTYTIARDTVQMFLPASSNVDAASSGAPMRCSPAAAGHALMAGTAYAGGQFVLGHAMNVLAPSSGPARATEIIRTGCAPQASSIQACWHDPLAAAQPDPAQDVARGVLVGVGELLDDLVFGAVARARQVNQETDQVRQRALAQGNDPDAALAGLPTEATEGLRIRLNARLPGRGQLIRQLTTTHAARSCAIQTSTIVSSCAAAALTRSSLPAHIQAHLIHAVVAACVWLTYLLFLFAHEQPVRRL